MSRLTDAFSVNLANLDKNARFGLQHVEERPNCRDMVCLGGVFQDQM